VTSDERRDSGTSPDGSEGGEDDRIFQRFVDQCLREKGYQPVGWR
jgi:hypothetical protein